MVKIELDIIALSHSMTQSHNYAIVLGEIEGNRRLPIVIGGFEAQAIAVAMEQMAPDRPLTHDLFKNTLNHFEIELKEVVINNLLDGIFYANLVCIKDGQQYEIDSRTSDAIALAVRSDCPIYTYDFIMESAGVELEVGSEDRTISDPTDKNPSAPTYEKMTEQSLKKLLDDFLANEDYEKAAKIRDELLRRKDKN